VLLLSLLLAMGNSRGCGDNMCPYHLNAGGGHLGVVNVAGLPPQGHRLPPRHELGVFCGPILGCKKDICKRHGCLIILEFSEIQFETRLVSRMYNVQVVMSR